MIKPTKQYTYREIQDWIAEARRNLSVDNNLITAVNPAQAFDIVICLMDRLYEDRRTMAIIERTIRDDFWVKEKYSD